MKLIITLLCIAATQIVVRANPEPPPLPDLPEPTNEELELIAELAKELENEKQKKAVSDLLDCLKLFKKISNGQARRDDQSDVLANCFDLIRRIDNGEFLQTSPEGHE